MYPTRIICYNYNKIGFRTRRRSIKETKFKGGVLMKRTLLFGSVAVAISLMTVSVVYANSEDYSNSKSTPLEAANEYFTAFKNGNGF